ncbi:MAG TPA: hypothetical protein VD815_07290 [Candidatus Saccharimonadales bacterium]|nr:hypothetical protein [Candidatus Saccharimonadales bacterium]
MTRNGDPETVNSKINCIVIFVYKAILKQLSKTTIDIYVDREAIMSQFRVWPFLSTTIMTFGERNRNPGHPLQ